MTEDPIEMLRQETVTLKRVRRQLAHQGAYSSWLATITGDVKSSASAILKIVLWHADKRAYMLERINPDELDQITELASELWFSAKMFDASNATQKTQSILQQLKNLIAYLEQALMAKTDDTEQYLQCMLLEMQAAIDQNRRSQWLGILRRMRAFAIRQKNNAIQKAIKLDAIKEEWCPNPSPEVKARQRKRESRAFDISSVFEASGELILAINQILQMEEPYPDLSALPPKGLSDLLDYRDENFQSFEKKVNTLRDNLYRAQRRGHL